MILIPLPWHAHVRGLCVCGCLIPSSRWLGPGEALTDRIRHDSSRPFCSLSSLNPERFTSHIAHCSCRFALARHLRPRAIAAGYDVMTRTMRRGQSKVMLNILLPVCG